MVGVDSPIQLLWAGSEMLHGLGSILVGGGDGELGEQQPLVCWLCPPVLLGAAGIEQ